MAFLSGGGNNKVTKQDLIDAGLNPDDFTKLVGSSVTKEEMATLKTEINTSIADTIRTAVGDLETRLRTPVKKEEGSTDDGVQKPDPNAVTEMDFVTDPVGSARKIANQTAGAVYMEQLKLASQFAWQNAVNQLEYMKIPAIRDEVKAEFDKFPIQNRTQPDILVKNIYDMVIGRHYEEIRKDTEKKEGKYNLVQTGGSTGQTANSTFGDAKKPGDELSAEELKAAASFNMTPEQYSAQKGKLKYA